MIGAAASAGSSPLSRPTPCAPAPAASNPVNSMILSSYLGASEQRRFARDYNHGIHDRAEALMGLHNFNGQIPANFPFNQASFDAMSVEDLQALLAEYSIPVQSDQSRDFYANRVAAEIGCKRLDDLAYQTASGVNRCEKRLGKIADGVPLIFTGSFMRTFSNSDSGAGS